jgi:hypothetical protein
MYSYKDIEEQIEKGRINRFDMLGIIVEDTKTEKPAHLIFGRISHVGMNSEHGINVQLRDAVAYDARENKIKTFSSLLLNEKDSKVLPPLSDSYDVTHSSTEFKSEIENRVDVLPTDFISILLEQQWEWDGKCFNCKKKVSPQWEACPYCRTRI